jgi:hypothetical protein
MPLWLKWRWEEVLRCMKERDYINESEKRAIEECLVWMCVMQMQMRVCVRTYTIWVDEKSQISFHFT